MFEPAIPVIEKLQNGGPPRSAVHIIRMTKLRRMNLVAIVARTEELKNKCKVLLGRDKWLLLRLRIICDDNIQMNLNEYDVRLLIGLILLRTVPQWQDCLNALMKLRVL